jgi:hypothetical protein
VAERAPGRGGAANVHANHVRQAAVKHVMYNVEPFRFWEPFGVYVSVKTRKCTAHESEFYREFGSLILLVLGTGYRARTEVFNLLAAVLEYKQVTTALTYRSVYSTR